MAAKDPVQSRLRQLREVMRERRLDAWLVPSQDPHQSEYVAAHWRWREWFSGFTGSAGTLVVTADEAHLWTDSRYYIQAESELQGSGIVLKRHGSTGVPDYPEWLRDTLPEGAHIGFDGALFSVSAVRDMRRKFAAKALTPVPGPELPAELWPGRPPLSEAPVFALDVAVCGKSRAGKLAELREAMGREHASHHLLASLDDLAWLLNLRGGDVPCNPVFTACALIGEQDATLFIAPSKVPDQIRSELAADGVRLAPYDAVLEHVAGLPPGSRLLFSPERLSHRLLAAVPGHCRPVEGKNPTTSRKAVKNSVEIAGIRRAMVKDGCALVQTLAWLQSVIGRETVTERGVAARLAAFRSKQGHYLGESFGTIAAYGPHGAICHYQPTAASDAELAPAGLFLLDAGAQYRHGTTDVTRTVALGELSMAAKREFTLVLKGHIALARSRFPAGTRGQQLDALARQALWRAGLNYSHGTGHGIGFFLNVHEGPQGISPTGKGPALEPGVVLSDEPGLYREGEYGIRIENLVLVAEDGTTDFGPFLHFEILTLCPIDLDAVDPALLDDEERQWLNAYHERVRDVLSPALPPAERQWLSKATRGI